MSKRRQRVQSIAATTTKTGLQIRCELDCWPIVSPPGEVSVNPDDLRNTGHGKHLPPDRARARVSAPRRFRKRLAVVRPRFRRSFGKPVRRTGPEISAAAFRKNLKDL